MPIKHTGTKPLPATHATRPRVHHVVEEDEDETEGDMEEGELSVDVYQTGTEIIIEAMVAGVKPEDLHLSITRDMVTIKGRRDGNTSVTHDDYFYKELYWGTFTRCCSITQFPVAIKPPASDSSIFHKRVGMAGICCDLFNSG